MGEMIWLSCSQLRPTQELLSESGWLCKLDQTLEHGGVFREHGASVIGIGPATPLPPPPSKAGLFPLHPPEAARVINEP